MALRLVFRDGECRGVVTKSQIPPRVWAPGVDREVQEASCTGVWGIQQDLSEEAE